MSAPRRRCTDRSHGDVLRALAAGLLLAAGILGAGLRWVV